MTLESKPWKLAPVEYAKLNDGGNLIPFYRFKVLSSPYDLLTLAHALTPAGLLTALTQTTLKEADYSTYLPDMYSHLFATNGKLFTRKYDPVACAKSTNHLFPDIPVETSESGPHACILSPTEIRLINSKFNIVWSVEPAAELDIDIGDDMPLMEEESAHSSVSGASSSSTPAAPATIDLVELHDIESDKDETTSEASLPLRSGLTDRQIRERQRVEEARLRAKLAAFRAQRAMDRYMQKYGDFSDSDETEYTETDVESDDLSE